MSRLDDISRCPAADSCESCGSGEDLDVATVDTPVGVYCLTLCGECAEDGRLPKSAGWSHAINLVWAHCSHLGISPDQAADIRERERSD